MSSRWRRRACEGLPPLLAVLVGALVLAPGNCTAFTAGTCPSNSSLKLVYSHYHSSAHCVCPVGEVCIGTACSVGQAQNGRAFKHNRHGFRASCEDCVCVVHVPASDFCQLRNRNMLWIMGTHHKTGSFLTQHMWGSLRRLVSPTLNIFSSQFHPISRDEWQHLDKSIDVVVTFHAESINQTLTNVTGRPYRFVHVIRDPVAAIVSAYLYETQRLKAHDSFHKVVRSAGTKEEALKAMTAAMQPELETMLAQFYMAEQDHHALNVKLEDFTANFDDTVHRIFRFLGVPEADVEAFVLAARQHDLQRAPEARKSSHITTGKYNKEPLLRAVLDDSRFGHALKKMKAALGYPCCP